MEQFFSADHHLFHNKEFIWKARGFSSVWEMDEVLLKQWNETVKPNDIVYYLGDMSFHPEKYLPGLNGRIHYIMGNHDYNKKNKIKQFPNVVFLDRFDVIQIDGIYITLCHYQMVQWYKSRWGMYHCFGHSHGRSTPIGKSIDVGWDPNRRLLTWGEIKDIMKERPNNLELKKDGNDDE
jgi:calcineurin-like phosphoesterase family protein